MVLSKMFFQHHIAGTSSGRIVHDDGRIDGHDAAASAAIASDPREDVFMGSQRAGAQQFQVAIIA